MKITLTANTAWNLHHFRRPLIRRLVAEGHEVLLLAAADRYADDLKGLAGVRFRPLRHLRPQSKNPWREWLLLLELYRIYRRERPDLTLHFTIKPNLYGSLAAGRLGIPNIATVTGLGYTFINDTPGHRFVRQLYRRAFRRADRIVFQNPDDYRLLTESGLAAAERSVLIPGSGVDTDYFQPREKPEPADNFVFLFIGRLLIDKGIREFVDAARRLHQPGLAFWVLGERPEDHPNRVPEAEWRASVDSGVIHWLGYEEDVRPVLARADALALPSYREGLPRAVLEAMAMAKPIITTDTAGCRETVEVGKNGFLVPIRSEEALAEAMERLWRMDDELRMEMGRYSRRKVVKEFSEAVVLNGYSRLLLEVCDHPQ